MYCRSCGSQVNGNASICTNCGFPPTAGKKYCPSCGKSTEPGDVFCPKCGHSLVFNASHNNQNNNIPSHENVSPKKDVSSQQSSTWSAVGIIIGIIGVAGAVISGVAMISDINDYNHGWGYSYTGHLTSHENTTIVILVLSIIAAIVGFCLAFKNKK